MVSSRTVRVYRLETDPYDGRQICNSGPYSSEAICMVTCPVYSGRVEALCLDDPVCDVIIGNIPGALPIELCPSHKDCEPQVAKCILVKETCCSHNVLLYSHADTRIGEKPFKYNICRKQFSRRSYLQRHKHAHTGEKNI